MKTSILYLFPCVLVLGVTAAFAAAPVEGKYVANGKEGKLAFALAKQDKPFSGKPVTLLVFTEKDASKDANPSSHAQFGDLGDALVVRLRQDGDKWDVIGTEFVHSALKHSGASGTGIVSASDLKVASGEISGHLATGPNADLFDEPLVVDLKFHVKAP